MTCTQRNFSVFMTSTFILFLQIQIYPAVVNSFYQQQQQKNSQNQSQHHNNYRHHNQHHNHHHHHHRHDHRDNQFNTFVNQYSHFRHPHHHTSLRNREQVQKYQIHHFQHKTASNFNGTPSWRSIDDKIQPSSSSSSLFHSQNHNNRHKLKDQRHNNDNNRRSDDGGGNFFYINDYYKNGTLKSHQHSNNSNNSRHHRYGNSYNHNERITTWDRKLLHQFNNDNIDNDDITTTRKRGYQKKLLGSTKVQSDRLNQHNIVNASVANKILPTPVISNKNWELPHKSDSQHLLKPRLKDGINNLDTSEQEDYYDDDDSQDSNDDDDDNDKFIGNDKFKLSHNEPMAFTLKPITSTPKAVQNLHTDLSYDYLYDEPTNGTSSIEEKSGSLTEEKWRNYGTAEAVEKSRRRHLSEAQIIAAHITRINLEAMCKYPRPKIIQINEASKRYVPHCTVLHRCSDDTGCCHSETQTCVAKKTVTVDLHFYAIPLKTKDPIVEVLSFVNHTECHCVDRFPMRSTTYAPDHNNLLNNKNSNGLLNTKIDKNGTCNCIRHFDVFEDDFDDDSDYQQQQIDITSSKNPSNNNDQPTCRCDCTTDNLTCQRLKRGQEGIPVDDRRCILEGRCVPPICEYGMYNRYSGRCPRSMAKRTIRDKT